ncbi:MAG: hypothetical protein APU95_02100 [Hadesarchaea archaeon YNP_N21]|jgi:histidyl-tRNA synthetase|nr:MAG: hypothetical protein APU95_02100 [Hadesarchaea archaeon YNP_N21]
MQRPRGTRDLFGEELESIRYVMRVMERIFKRYGYAEVETPIFEHLELFTKKSGEEVIRQIYSFQDKSGRWMALRPELTAPVVRFFNNELKSRPKPLKLFYFGSCFRYEEPQAGRWRQFMQSGVEIIGSSRPESDAEVISLTNDVMVELGLRDRKIRIGNIRLLREILSSAGVKGEAQDPIMRAVDSRDEERIRKALDGAGIRGDYREMFESTISLKGGEDVLAKTEKTVGELEGARKAIENLRDVLKFIMLLGVESFEIDFGIARGLEYYTDIVFEVYVDGVQVAGGGRYDELVELLGGEPCPAVGVGLGVDRIAQILMERKAEIPLEQLVCVVLPVSEKVIEEGLKITRILRNAGISTEFDLMGRSLKRAISYADARGARYVVIVGEKDLAEGKITLRDMRTGDQEIIARQELIERLKPWRALG